MPEIKSSTSAFSSHHEIFNIGETKYSVRLLNMHNSCFIYIGLDAREILEEIGFGMPVTSAPSGVASTVALGPQLGCESQPLAEKLSKRLLKPVYVSCNIPYDRMVYSLLEKNLVRIVQENHKSP